jgi:hypothetical protein
LTQQPATPSRNLLFADSDELPVNRLAVSPSRPRLVWDRSLYLNETYGHLGETALRFIELAYGAATKGRLSWVSEEELF